MQLTKREVALLVLFKSEFVISGIHEVPQSNFHMSDITVYFWHQREVHNLVEVSVLNIKGEIILPLHRVGLLLFREVLFASLLLLMLLSAFDVELQVVA